MSKLRENMDEVLVSTKKKKKKKEKKRKKKKIKKKKKKKKNGAGHKVLFARFYLAFVQNKFCLKATPISPRL